MDKQYGLQIAAQIAEQDYLRFDRSISTQPGVLHDFREALLEKGFQFRYLHETLQYMPKEKDIIVPLVLQYFQYATEIEDKKHCSLGCIITDCIRQFLYLFTNLRHVPQKAACSMAGN